MIINKKIFAILVLFLYLFFHMKIILAQPDWNEWVFALKQEAVAQQIDPVLFDMIFNTMNGPDLKILRFEQTQPEHRMTYLEYQHTRADPYKIMLGRREYQKNKNILFDIEHDYPVDPCFVVALWGMESSYGRYTGHFSVIRSLATLAYASQRKDNFRPELFDALKILQQHQVDLDQFKGEWAGASGQPQFLPSSWFKYAVDYDQDGRKDIWNSKEDTFASIANYLIKNGWQNNMPFTIEVNLPAYFDIGLIGKNIEKTVEEWSHLGVVTTLGDPLPYPALLASIVQPYGGPTFLTYPNFKVVLSYNNSIYYAETIGYMANQICGK